MSAPSASNGAMTPSARAEPDTRLNGRWLLLARVVWVGVVALIVGFFITSLPVYLELLQAPCAPTTCSFWQLSLAAAQTLQRLGFSSADYATYTLTLLIVFGVVWLAVALVLFWRKSDDWMALLVALLLVTLGTAELTEVVEAMPSFWQVPAICLNESAYVLLFLVFSLFPNGRFVPRWMRWLVVGDLADALLHGSIFIPGSPFHQGRYPFLFSLVFFFFWFAWWWLNYTATGVSPMRCSANRRSGSSSHWPQEFWWDLDSSGLRCCFPRSTRSMCC